MQPYRVSGHHAPHAKSAPQPAVTETHSVIKRTVGTSNTMGSFAKPAGPRFSIQVLYDDSERWKLRRSSNW